MRTSVPSIAHIPTQSGSGSVRWANFVKRLTLIWEVYKERYRLTALDSHALRDLGIDRDQVAREANRSFFRYPRKSPVGANLQFGCGGFSAMIVARDFYASDFSVENKCSRASVSDAIPAGQGVE